jgi:preprotein translocase subunit SecB
MFKIDKIYTTEMSFEAPYSHEIFSYQWNPGIHLDIQVTYKNIKINTILTNLCLTLIVKNNNKIAFIIEIVQTGIFNIIDNNKNNLSILKKTIFPDILYPYALDRVYYFINRSGYPYINISPILEKYGVNDGD